MKKLSKLNLRENAEVLNDNEMKKLSGGYGKSSFDCRRKYGNEEYSFNDVPFSLGYRWCDFWTTAGWECTCVNNY